MNPRHRVGKVYIVIWSTLCMIAGMYKMKRFTSLRQNMSSFSNEAFWHNSNQNSFYFDLCMQRSDCHWHRLMKPFDFIFIQWKIPAWKIGTGECNLWFSLGLIYVLTRILLSWTSPCTSTEQKSGYYLVSSITDFSRTCKSSSQITYPGMHIDSSLDIFEVRIAQCLEFSGFCKIRCFSVFLW